MSTTNEVVTIGTLALAALSCVSALVMVCVREYKKVKCCGQECGVEREVKTLELPPETMTLLNAIFTKIDIIHHALQALNNDVDSLKNSIDDDMTRLDEKQRQFLELWNNDTITTLTELNQLELKSPEDSRRDSTKEEIEDFYQKKEKRKKRKKRKKFC